jgi:capsular polysaccharide biosynthesis protein
MCIEEDPMNLLDYARIFVRRGWIIVLLALLAAGATFLFSRTITPTYRSTQTILIVPSRPDWGLQQAAVQLLNSRREYLYSSLRAQEVIDALQIDQQPYDLLAATTIAPNRDNMTIEISVDLPATSDAEAAKTLNPITIEWGNRLIQYQNEINQEARREDRVTARPKDNPTIARLRPNMLVNTLIGGLAGLFIGAVLVFVLEFLESAVIQRRVDVERVTDLPVLAVIPD